MAQAGARRDQSFEELDNPQTPEGEEFDDATIDACLVAAGKFAEHHQMLEYSRFLAWARAMGHNEELGLSS